MLPHASEYTKTFAKDWERVSRSSRYDMTALRSVMLLLAANDVPPALRLCRLPTCSCSQFALVVVGMGKIFRYSLVLLAAAATSAGVTILYHTVLSSGATPKLDLSYVDFLSITLTALGLMITILGFFVAAAGVIGWATLETKLRDHSMSYFKDQLSKDGELRSELEELFAEIAYEGVEEYRNKPEDNGDQIAAERDRDYHD